MINCAVVDSDLAHTRAAYVRTCLSYLYTRQIGRRTMMYILIKLSFNQLLRCFSALIYQNLEIIKWQRCETLKQPAAAATHDSSSYFLDLALKDCFRNYVFVLLCRTSIRTFQPNLTAYGRRFISYSCCNSNKLKSESSNEINKIWWKSMAAHVPQV